IGPERITMQMHAIQDMRNFWANDLRFLEQFERPRWNPHQQPSGLPLPLARGRKDRSLGCGSGGGSAMKSFTVVKASLLKISIAGRTQKQSHSTETHYASTTLDRKSVVEGKRSDHSERRMIK